MKTRLDVLREEARAREIEPDMGPGYPMCSRSCPRFYTTMCSAWDLDRLGPCIPLVRHGFERLASLPDPGSNPDR